MLKTSVTELLATVLARGNGAAFQRNTYQSSSRLPSVVASAATASAL
jgi:hypothetical protein